MGCLGKLAAANDLKRPFAEIGKRDLKFLAGKGGGEHVPQSAKGVVYLASNAGAPVASLHVERMHYGAHQQTVHVGQ